MRGAKSEPRQVTLPVRPGLTVPGLLQSPAAPGGARLLYVLAHGAGAGMDHAFLASFARLLEDRGVATLRFQFPYTAAGKRRPDPPALLVEAVRAAVALAAREEPGAALFAGGKSMGGRMTSLAASESPLPGVRGLVFLGFPLHPAGKPGAARGAHLSKVGLPLLFLQGERDKLCDLPLLRPLLEALRPAPVLHTVPEGDHSFAVPKRTGRTADEVQAELADVAAGWMERPRPR